jgi:hypothetical protein
MLLLDAAENLNDLRIPPGNRLETASDGVAAGAQNRSWIAHRNTRTKLRTGGTITDPLMIPVLAAIRHPRIEASLSTLSDVRDPQNDLHSCSDGVELRVDR